MPNGNGKISITVIDQDGHESAKTVKDSTKVSEVAGKDVVVLLNGQEQRPGRDRELRANDRVQILRRSYKNG
jgi:malate/lactate dehydrogenase